MKCIWCPIHKALAGVFVAALCAFPQATTSARPGAINYVEGHAYIDGQNIEQSQIGHLNLDVNQTIRTDENSKAEILLTPGVFIRLGGNSELKMVAASLTDTQVVVMHGEALVDVAQLFKDNNIQILESGASTRLLKQGLYRFDANVPRIAVYDGKAMVMAGENKIDLKKGSQLTLNSGLLKAKFDTKQHDNLYAWSNVRSEYAAEASYATANNIYINNGWGWGPGWGAGWFWNPWYSSWAFVPAAGYFYDPFGWGFFSPAAVIYAPRYSGRGRYGYYPVNRAVARPGIGAAGIAAQSHGVTTMRPAPTMRMSAPRMR